MNFFSRWTGPVLTTLLLLLAAVAVLIAWKGNRLQKYIFAGWALLP